MNTRELLDRFHEIAHNPKKMKDEYLNAGRKVVLTAPVYTPEEMIHALGAVPMGAWGADIELKESKTYFPAFICSVMQSILELGMTGVYDGASAIVIPSLCDSLKVLGENWKCAVKSIPFVPMTYPQNRKSSYGQAFTKARYEKVAGSLEEILGTALTEEAFTNSIQVYNTHNAVMRKLVDVLAKHGEITAAERSDIFKSAFFMAKEEHTALVEQLLDALAGEEETAGKIRIITSGILADSPSLTGIFDDLGMQIVADDVAAESRQYRTDTPEGETALDRLVAKFTQMDQCSVLYDPEKTRVDSIVRTVQEYNAQGVVVVLTKFCDPEEFDYPLIRRACEAQNIPVMLVEVDRQMVNYEQARTLLETFRDNIQER